jgi:hypothetical protein
MQRKKGQEISCPLDRGSFFSTSRGHDEIDDRQLPNFTARLLAPLSLGGRGVIAEAACEHLQLALPSWLRCSYLVRQGQHSRCRLRCVWASLERCHDPRIKTFANAFRLNDGAVSRVTTRRSLGEHTNPQEGLSLLRSSAFYLMKSVSRS